jgi:hypothetical protein
MTRSLLVAYAAMNLFLTGLFIRQALSQAQKSRFISHP